MSPKPCLPASLIAALLALPALAQPVREIGLLPGDASIAPAYNSQQDQSSATGGGQTLVVWSDYRAQNVGNATNESAGDIFGLRLGADGQPIDAHPFAIDAGFGEQRYPVVAWNGENWLVAYRSQDPVGQYFEDRIRAVRVSPAGVVLDPTPLLIASSDLPFRLAGRAGQWLISYSLYHDDGYGTFIAGRRLGGDGTFLDATPLTLLDWSYGQSALVAAQDEYLVAGPDWNDSNLLRARRIGSDGGPIGGEFTVPGLNIASRGTEYYVAWLSQYVNLVGSRMSASGVLANPSGSLITPDYSPYHHANVAFDGARWWVEWGAASEIHTVRVSPGGDVLDPGGGPKLPIVIGGNIDFAYSPQLQPRQGGGVCFIWNDSRPSLGYDSNVWSMPVDPSNVAGPERCVSTGTPTQHLPDLAGGPGGRSAVAFVSRFAGDNRVLLHLLSPAGEPITSEPVEVARGANIQQAGIAWNGSTYLVTWDEGPSDQPPSHIKARRLAADGSFVDATPLDIMPGFSPSAGAVGDDFLIAASKFVNNQTIAAIARRIDGPTGAPLDPAPLTLLTGYVSTGPRVRGDGSRWVVTYHSHWSHDSAQADIVYNFVHPDGTFTQPLNPTSVSGSTGTPDVAFSGDTYLFVWRSNTLANANYSISGRLMNPDGSFPGDDFVIAEAPGRQLRPVAAWDGATFVVAWDDQRNQQAFFDERTDIYAARITQTGTVLDPGGLLVVGNADADATAAILGVESGRSVIASTRLTLSAGHDTYRIGLSSLGEVSCLPDLNADGVLDLFDFLAFTNLFNAHDPGADFDGNGSFDLFDFLAFVNAFNTGC
jgi:hypothetical protein